MSDFIEDIHFLFKEKSKHVISNYRQRTGNKAIIRINLLTGEKDKFQSKYMAAKASGCSPATGYHIVESHKYYRTFRDIFTFYYE